MDAMPIKTEEMTHRIGRFYTGRPSWRTRLRALRRRLGDASLPLSEEEWLMQVAHRLKERKCKEPVYALRIAYPLPRVLLAADGKTTVQYKQAPKNGSTSLLNLFLELTGEAAYRDWRETDHWFHRPSYYLQGFKKFRGRRIFVTVNEKCIGVNTYMPRDFFSPEPCADIRFCVVRDPVERFLSSVEQFQITFFRDRQRLPTINGDVIDAWLDMMKAVYDTLGQDSTSSQSGIKSEIKKVSAQTGFASLNQYPFFAFRQTEFLGHDASWYTHIFSLRDLAPAHKLLSELAGKPLSAFHANSSGERQQVYVARGLKLVRPQLTPAQRRKIEAAYAEDYRVFGRWF